MRDILAYFGLARSLLIYYGRPFRIRRLMALYSPFVRPGDLCFDIGAHVGTHTRALSNLGAHVVALEPQPLFFDFLRSSLSNNPQVYLKPLAAGSQAGVQKMLVSRMAPTVSTLSSEWISRVGSYRSFRSVRWESEIDVEVTTLDALIEEHGLPVFCKIDVEGAEADVLQGLSVPVQSLSFEYLPGSAGSLEACLCRLAELEDYSFNWSPSEEMRFGQPGWLDPETLKGRISALEPGSPAVDIYARIRQPQEESAG